MSVNDGFGMEINDVLFQLFMFIEHQTTERTRRFDSDEMFDIFI